jgi:hypothetical protein
MKVDRWYHDRDGMYLGRFADGSVRLAKTDGLAPDAGGKIEFEWTFDAGTWGSIVLSMSAFDERPCDWHRFMDHHQGRADLLKSI